MGQVKLNLNSAAAIAVQNSASLVANIANQYIVSTANAPAGISGFVFDVIDIEGIHLQSDATDHYIETNSAVQDHVVQKPIEFTLKGFVGELKNIMQVQIGNVFYQVQGLAPVVPLLPVFSVQDTQVYQDIANAAAQAVAAINSIPSVSSLIPQLLGTQTYQQQAYAKLFSLWVNDTLCTVQTPYGLLTNMLIIDLRPSQSGDTRFVSEFNITFKQITQVSTASTMTTNPANPNPAGSGTQSGNPINAAIGGPVAQGVQPPQNYPSQVQITSEGLANRYSDLTAVPPPTPGASSSGLPAPAFNTLFPENDQTFNTLSGVVTTPVPALMP